MKRSRKQLKAFFKKLQYSKRGLINIYVRGQKHPVGRMMVGPTSSLEQEVAVHIEPAYRGRGLGTQAFKHSRIYPVKRVYATIDRKNIVSQKAAKKAGFKKARRGNIFNKRIGIHFNTWTATPVRRVKS